MRLQHLVDSQMLKPLGLLAPLHVYIHMLTVLGELGGVSYN